MEEKIETRRVPVERWCDVLGFEGFYQVSNLGQIRSNDRVELARNKWCVFVRKRRGKVLKYSSKGRGYIELELYKCGVRSNVLLHRIIYEAFKGKIPDGSIIHHKDHNPDNNCLINLELTNSMIHNNYHKHPAWNKGLKGFRSGKRDKNLYKSQRKMVRCVETEEVFESVNDAALSVNVKPQSISRALHNKGCRAGGNHYEFYKK